MNNKGKVYVVPENTQGEYDVARCRKIATEFALPLYPDQNGGLDPEADFLLIVGKGSLCLKPVNHTASSLGSKPISPDWLRTDVSSAAGRNASQPLVKAIRGSKNRFKQGIVLDGTAGWGEDSWILACFGFGLVSLERNLVAFPLLRDAHARAGTLFPRVSSRMRLLNMDTLDLIRSLSVHKEQRDSLLPSPDVVYLDPMFPDNEKRKTAEKKPARILRLLEEMSCNDNAEEEEELLELSLQVAGNKVVIKRPASGALYAGGSVSPVHSVYGKGVRFDVYISKKQG